MHNDKEIFRSVIGVAAMTTYMTDLTLRDIFAGLIMASFCGANEIAQATSSRAPKLDPEMAAANAVNCADVLLAKLAEIREP
jgi:hypothetical protein